MALFKTSINVGLQDALKNPSDLKKALFRPIKPGKKAMIQKIHDASMAMLTQSGMRFRHPEVIKILGDEGVRIIGETAYFTEEQILRWVKKAPSEFTLFARNPDHDLTIGGDRWAYAPGYGAPNIITREGHQRRACLGDYITFLKLFHVDHRFQINGGILVQPSDLPSVTSFPVMLLATLLHSDKCLIGGGGGREETQIVMDMLSLVFGGRQELLSKPRITTIVNTLSPLQMDRDSLETLLIYARHNQPVMLTPAAMAGTTAPVTLAGAIAMSNAEALAGIALYEMINPGGPIIYGFQTTTADMRTASWTVGSPEHALAVTYGARLAKFYGLPCRGGGAANDAKHHSVQSGYESMLTLLASRLAGMNLITMAAGTLDGHRAMSVDQFVVDLEIMGMVDRFMAGVDASDDDRLAVEVVKNAGPGGEFLTCSHTIKYCRKEPWMPAISLRGSLGGEMPQEKLQRNIDVQKEKLLEAYHQPEFSAEIQQALSAYLAEHHIDTTMLFSDETPRTTPS